MSKADMFLSVTGQKTGLIKGESDDQQHKDEIDVLGWSWGISAQQQIGGGGPAGKAVLKELHLQKYVDRASTALMSMTRTNEIIKKAVLAVRKAGTTQQEYFKLTIEKGRITSYDVRAPESPANPKMVELLNFSFQKIEVEYRVQGADGQLLGSSLYSDEIG